MESSNGAYDHEKILSSIATNNGHGEDVEYFEGWKAYDNDPYHPSNNPSGVIQMGLAENQLGFDLIKEWMLKNQQASICTREGVNKFDDIANFQDYHGLPEFRSAVAKFMGKARGERVSFEAERIVMSGGATGANETLMFCLADPGEAFLVPSPYYPAFNRDLGWRTGVKLIPIKCNRSNNNFKITEESLKLAYEEAQNNQIRVKGVLITNPSNPLGTVHDKETLKMLVNFVNDRRIHLICDEIFATTVFSLQPRFTSVAEVLMELSHVNFGLFHIIYSLSKDLGMPGFRVGVVYSYNDRVVTTARRMSSFGLVSSQTQHMLAALLSDDGFVSSYLDKIRERLYQRHQHLTSELAKIGIECLKSNAGLFVWMDLRHLMKEPTMEEELKLWRVIINDVKINVSPGSSFHCDEPGWFRVCFANMDDDTVDVSLQRIRSFVRREKEVDNTTTKPPLKKRKEMMKLGHLSFNSRRFEENSMLLSPHSPIPQSPLVKARN